MKVKEDSEKAGLKLNIQKMKVMASGPITSWQTDGDKQIFLVCKITAYGDCSHEIERHLLIGRKAMTNLDSVLKSRHYFSDKSPYSQIYGFAVVMYGCESLTIKKAGHWGIDAFELWFGEDSWASLGLQGNKIIQS